MKRELMVVDIGRLVGAWQRAGGPPRFARLLGRHPMLFGLIGMLWMAPLLPSAWNKNGFIFSFGLGMTFVLGLGVFLMSKGVGEALEAYEKRPPDAVVPEQEEDTEAERWQRSKAELAMLLMACAGVFFGILWVAIGIGDSRDRVMNLWGGVTWLLLGVVNAVLFARRTR